LLDSSTDGRYNILTTFINLLNISHTKGWISEPRVREKCMNGIRNLMEAWNPADENGVLDKEREHAEKLSKKNRNIKGSKRRNKKSKRRSRRRNDNDGMEEEERKIEKRDELEGVDIYSRGKELGIKVMKSPQWSLEMKTGTEASRMHALSIIPNLFTFLPETSEEYFEEHKEEEEEEFVTSKRLLLDILMDMLETRTFQEKRRVCILFSTVYNCPVLENKRI